MNDIEKICKDCENPFTITVKEQERFAQLRDDNNHPLELPKRCFDCRKARKTAGPGFNKPSNLREFKKFPHNKSSFNNKKGKRWDQE